MPDTFEMLIAALCLISGIPIALGFPTVNSVTSLLPVWLIRCWGADLALAGLLILIGLIAGRAAKTVNRRMFMIQIEQAGLTMLGTGSAVLMMSIMTIGGWRAALPVGTYLALTLSCYFRTIEISDVKRGIERSRRRDAVE